MTASSLKVARRRTNGSQCNGVDGHISISNRLNESKPREFHAMMKQRMRGLLILFLLVFVVIRFDLLDQSMATVTFSSGVTRQSESKREMMFEKTSESLNFVEDDDKANNLPSCSILQFSVSAAKQAVKSGQPILLTGWERPSGWKKAPLMQNLGHYTQYLKDGTVQPYRDTKHEYCTLPGSQVAALLTERTDKELLFFTNDVENPHFLQQLYYTTPPPLQHITGFRVFSALSQNRSHSFHRHGEAWLGQVEGRRVWWFLDPSESKPARVNACHYLSGAATPPPSATVCVQHPGTIIHFPKDYYHATCALDEWTVGVGAQQGPLIRQIFPVLSAVPAKASHDEIQRKTDECLGPVASPKTKDETWTWFQGDLNAYYNHLMKQDHRRNPQKIASYAVHRWMGEQRSTELHYQLLDELVGRRRALSVVDAGCGLGSALMWLEQKHRDWNLTGYTVSEEQHKFIQTQLPQHRFQVYLRSYDDLLDGYDFLYSIEALIHSFNISKTLQEWSKHAKPGGFIAIIDDFLAVGTQSDDKDVQDFAKSWLANSLLSTTDLVRIGRIYGLQTVQVRDLTAEYNINELNYNYVQPEIVPTRGKTHQGWMGSKWRQRLTVQGKLTYNMVVLQKQVNNVCQAVPKRKSGSALSFVEITPELMSGVGKSGGSRLKCISSWYCCNKGIEWYDRIEAQRTDNFGFLRLPRDLFGHYVDSMARHLNEFYLTLPDNVRGRFLDIGGAGSTASGMTQVTSKFQHFAGPLEYWKLDSDPAAKELERTIYCDIDNCPGAETCGFDVTFSHTVFEHAKRPWEAFDTVARITKKGGLTLHLVPFSYQYHATPDDNYRFSHTALTTLLEDRGFTVLEVGYDICTKPDQVLRRKVDEHYDMIWLTFVIGMKD